MYSHDLWILTESIHTKINVSRAPQSYYTRQAILAQTFISADDLQIISLQLLVAHLLLFVQSSIIHRLQRGEGPLMKKHIYQYQ